MCQQRWRWTGCGSAAGRACQAQAGAGDREQEGCKRRKGRRRSQGEPRAPLIQDRARPPSSSGRRGHATKWWSGWLQTVLRAAARNSPLARVIADTTLRKWLPVRRVARGQQLFFMCGGAARPSPRRRARCRRRLLASALATTLMICTLWLRSGGRVDFRDGLPRLLRHSDPAWLVCLAFGRAASRLDPADAWGFGRGRLGEILDCMLNLATPFKDCGARR